MKKSSLRISLTLGLVITLSASGRAALNWQQVTEIPGAETIRLYTHNDTLYSCTKTLIYRFDQQENKWDTLTPLDSGVTYIGAIIKSGNRLLAGTYNNGVFESDNNGLSWSPANTGLSGLGSNQIIDFTIRGDSLYVGTSGAGIFVMNLNGSAQWTSYSNGMPDNIASDIMSLYNHDNYLIAGAGYNTTIYRNEPDTNGWTEYPFSNFDPRGAAMLDMTSRAGLLYGAASNGLYISRDSGATWERSVVTNYLIASGAVAADRDRVYGSIFLSLYGGFYFESTGSGWEVIDSVPGILPFDLAVLGGRLYSARFDGLWYADLNPTGVPDDDHTLPNHVQLQQNYPNPFNPTTEIEFYLPQKSTVTLQVFNVLGQKIRTLVDATQSAGKHVVAWDGTDNAGHTFPSGVYFYRLATDGYTSCRTMLLIK
jgi:hypothetical protein